MTTRVLVTHPGRQHSHRAALALHRAGRLAGYWSGVPSLERHRGMVPSALWRRFVRYAPIELPEAVTRTATWVPAMRRLSDRFPGPIAMRIDLAACRAFDGWVARGLTRPTLAASAVLACEISALSTFRRAAGSGWVKLLDAPSIHHSAQDRLHPSGESPAVARRVRDVKDEEIALADAIVTVSELARSTYLDAGVSAEKVVAVPLGAELALFDRPRASTRSGECRFLFAGAAIPRKGFDLLVEAFQRLVAESVPFHLRLVGPQGSQSRLIERLPVDSWSSAGPVPQERLAVELSNADCLVLPSRNDSYGMVVAEALAAGVPAIVSNMVGAAELIGEGIDGWVVPNGNVGALADRLRACSIDPELPRGMREACRGKSRAATWEAYEARLLATLTPILDRGAA
jgi:glycosyltransferase involved in cell wall biosynthesis